MSTTTANTEPTSIQTDLGVFSVSRYKQFFNTSKPVSFGFDLSKQPASDSAVFHFGGSVRRPVWLLGYEKDESGTIKLVPKEIPEARFILKAQSDSVPLVPELEKIVLELAELAGMEVADAMLIETSERQTALLIKRVDGPVRNKPVEPVSRLLPNATAATTWEQVALEVKKASSNSGFDLLGVLERALFSFLVGSYNVSPRKFFLAKDADGIRKLGPISGFLPMLLLFSKQIDPQDFAFSFNGKTRKLTVQDFLYFGSSVGLYGKQIDNAVKRFTDVLPAWERHIRASALPSPVKQDFLNLIDQRAGKLMLRRRF